MRAQALAYLETRLRVHRRAVEICHSLEMELSDESAAFASEEAGKVAAIEWMIAELWAMNERADREHG